MAGIDNDMRRTLFGSGASTIQNQAGLAYEYPSAYKHYAVDIRDAAQIETVFREFRGDIGAIIHTAAQPSHDWAAREPLTDFGINAVGTLNLLECARLYAPTTPFVFTSTNKVYGDQPNYLPLIECATRWEVDPSHAFSKHGISEDMSIDHCKHSLFGCSKVAADVMVQEYGRYFEMPTVCFRGGCLTGPGHKGAKAHGFLAYLVKCAVNRSEYRIFGHKGKQVRDNIHADDLVDAFWQYVRNPRVAKVYNIGGGRYSNCSMIEAIQMCERITGRKMEVVYLPEPRSGDHIWWVSDTRKFERDYPDWRLTHNAEQIVTDIAANA